MKKSHAHLRRGMDIAGWRRGKVALLRDERQRRWAEELSTVSLSDFGDLRGWRALPDDEVENINRLLLARLSVEQIADRTGHAESTIVRYREILKASGAKVHAPPPPYERREIPYERATELPLLADGRQMFSLDEEDEDGRTLHCRIASCHGFNWAEVFFDDERDGPWLKAFERNLPSNVAVTYRKAINGERLTKDEEVALRAEALLLFEDFAE